MDGWAEPVFPQMPADKPRQIALSSNRRENRPS
jgi:hypothetical protein